MLFRTSVGEDSTALKLHILLFPIRNDQLYLGWAKLLVTCKGYRCEIYGEICS